MDPLKAGVLVEAGALVLLLAAFAYTPLLLVHWAMVAAGFALLARSPAARPAAVKAGLVFLVGLGAGLAGAGLSVGGFGVAAGEGDWAAAGTTLAILMGPLAVGAFAALRGSLAVRNLGLLAGGLMLAALLGFPTRVPDAVLGGALLGAVLAATLAFVLDAATLLKPRGRAEAALDA